MKTNYNHTTFFQLILVMFLMIVSVQVWAAPSTTYKSLKNGSWTDATVWNPATVPSTTNLNGDALLIYHAITLTGDLTMNNNCTIHVYPGATLTITGNLIINNSFDIIIDAGGTFIVNGSFTLNNNTDGKINGLLQVGGNLTTGGGSSTIIGTGSVVVGGTISDPNSQFPTALITGTIFYAGTWTSGSAWNDPTTWSSSSTSWVQVSSVPANRNTAVILNGKTVNVTALAEVNSITVNTGGSLVINDGITLEVAKANGVLGFLTNKGTITLNSNSNLAISSNVTTTNSILANDGTIVANNNSNLILRATNSFVNNGTFTANSASIFTFAGINSISGTSVTSFGNIVISGSLNAPAGNMNIAGNWTNTGTFNHNNGTVIFNGTADQTITNSAIETFYNFTVSGSNVILPVTSKVTVNAATTIIGKLTLKSSSTGTASFLPSGTYTQSGTVNAERYLSPNMWHAFFSPLSNVNKTSLTTTFYGANPNFYWYNETTNDYWNASVTYNTSGWATEPNTKLRTDRGYFIYTPENRTYTLSGDNMNVTDKTYTLTYTPHSTSIPAGYSWSSFDGWNLVGNPYTSAINWDVISPSLTNVDKAFYYYDGSNYKYYGVGGIGINGGSAIIAPNQGIFVKVSSNAPTSITIPKASRTHNASTFFKSTKATFNMVRMQIEKNGFIDESVVRVIPGAKDSYEGEYDIYKRFSWDNTKPQMYTYNSVDNQFAINTFSDSTETKQIPVGFYLGVAGEHTITFTENSIENANVYLEDKLLNKMINISIDKSYTFTDVKGLNKTRFVLHFNLNHAPLVDGTVNDQTVTEDQSFSFASPVHFSDSDLGDVVSESVECPTWLKYDASTKTFSGIPTNTEVGNYTIKVTAVDMLNAQTEVSFKLEVLNVNNAPMLLDSIPNQEIDENTNYSYTLPSDLFTDIDLNDNLNLSVQLADGNNLPSWLTYDSNSKSLYGVSQNPGDLNLVVKATDNDGASVYTEFKLTIKTVTSVEVPTTVQIKIYPNPSNGILFIENQTGAENMKLIVRDNTGKVVLEQNAPDQKTKVQINNLTNGLYFIELRDNKESKVYKIVKN